MPSQDLLFPILPRAPATPSPDDIKREVTQISQKHQLRKTSTDNGESQQRQQAYPSAKRDQSKPKEDDHKPDPEHQIDLFV
ncbi:MULTISPECIES: hypothetical protein [Aeromonas]|jgi:hypothetical protein|uniref:Uncharacterized protein n=1 Tax=Aeromonas popoffii TaxID=70856 RepID=A0ABS5GPD4_9GAMM|nr:MULTISPECIES: hypothetical protein [Aeromonas]MBR7628769.1 hypothetical protein [Aeromonas popoffii]MDF2415519.1 hypothetical protein [Aeromonas sp. 1HA1]PTT45068.1 hypothetical protein DBR19_21135 [Aeromonas sp. HMWF014]